MLVHCAAGVSRSASVVVAYLMYKKGLSLDDALDFVKSKRECVDPNFGFREQLQIFDQILKKYRKELFPDSGAVGILGNDQKIGGKEEEKKQKRK